ncbi:MAG: hypothetical protein LBO74_08715 [Candidatus Symbiothrix sp.]|jgi:hypothetical protein|nr:hypothetical protein [Candidatus Symbiothrix sp.]
MDKSVIKTEYQLEKEARELAIYNDWNELMEQPGAMASAVETHLMKKYNIHAKSTIWFSRKRTEERLKEGNL